MQLTGKLSWVLILMWQNNVVKNLTDKPLTTSAPHVLASTTLHMHTSY